VKEKFGLQSYFANDFWKAFSFAMKSRCLYFEVFLDEGLGGTGIRAEHFSEADRLKIKETAQTYKKHLTVHSPITVDYTKLTDSLIFARDIGAELLTIHPLSTRSDFLKPMLKNIITLAEFALSINIKLGLENGLNFGKYQTAEDMNKIFNEIYQSSSQLTRVVGLTFDVGHANLASTPAEFLNGFNYPVIHVHLHDNNSLVDSHSKIGEGNINFTEIFSILKKRNYSGAFILERWHDTIIEELEYLVQLYRNA